MCVLFFTSVTLHPEFLIYFIRTIKIIYMSSTSVFLFVSVSLSLSVWLVGWFAGVGECERKRSLIKKMVKNNCCIGKTQKIRSVWCT